MKKKSNNKMGNERWNWKILNLIIQSSKIEILFKKKKKKTYLWIPKKCSKIKKYNRKKLSKKMKKVFKKLINKLFERSFVNHKKKSSRQVIRCIPKNYAEDTKFPKKRLVSLVIGENKVTKNVWKINRFIFIINNHEKDARMVLKNHTISYLWTAWRVSWVIGETMKYQLVLIFTSSRKNFIQKVNF